MPTSAFSAPLAWRKHVVLVQTPSDVEEKMKKCIKRTEAQLWKHGDDPNVDRNCWLDSAKLKNKSRTIHRQISFYRNGRVHKVSLNHGVIAMKLRETLSKKMIDGLLQPRSWHLSHLCGNWICLNPSHMTVESPRDNQRRKSCLNKYTTLSQYTASPNLRRLCPHSPKCKTQHRLPEHKLHPPKYPFQI